MADSPPPESLAADFRKPAGIKAESLVVEWQIIFDAIPNPVFVRDADGVITQCNLATEQIAGKSREEIIGRHCWEIMHGTSGPIMECPIPAMKKSRQRESMLLPVKNRWFQVYVDPVIDGAGNLIGAAHTMEDITEGKQAEDALLESEDLFRHVFEAANVGKSITTPEGRISVNQAFADLLGYRRQELGNKTWQELTPPEDIEPTRAQLAPLLSGEKDAARFTKRYLHKNGSVVWADVSTALRRGEDGKPRHFITTIVDITERKLAEDKLHLSEERFSNAFHIGPAGMTITRVADGKFIDANESFLKMFDFNRDEVVGHTSTELNIWTPDERRKLIQLQLESGGLRDFELVARSKYGRLINLLFSSKPMELEGETCHITTMIDITRRKQAEDALLNQKQLLSTIIESSAEAIFAKDIAGKYHSINEAGARMLGYSAAEVIGRTDRDLLPADTADEFRKTDEYVMSSGQVYEREEIGVINGKTYIFLAHKTPWRDNSGNIVGVIGISNNITVRKQAENALRESEARLKKAQEIAKLGSWIYDLSGRILWSDETYRIYGVTPETFIPNAESFNNLIHPEDRPAMQEWIRACIAKDKPGELVFRAVLPSGEVRFISGRGELICDAQGRPMHMAGTAQDITEPKQAEIRLHKLNRVYALLSNINQTIVRVHEPQKLFEEACRIAVEQGGFRMAWISRLDPLTKQVRPAASAGVTDDYLETLNITLNDSERGQGPTAIALRTGRHVVVNEIASAPSMSPWRADALRLGYRASAAFPLNIAGETRGTLNLYAIEADFFDEEEIKLLDELAANIAFALEFAEQEKQRQQLEAQFQQAQKMESVGRLAGGVAHDFNNMLSIIIGYGEIVLARLNANDPTYHDIEQIVEAGKKSADLTRQLLAFSSQQTVLPQVTDLNKLIANSQKMLKRLVGEDIDLRFSPKDHLWKIHIDPTQVDQILANLTVNARDAIAGVGSILIETANVVLEESSGTAHEWFTAGDYVMLKFSDSGSGMDKETVQKIFDPFFTTKEAGKGTGLGLSTVYGIVKQNHGLINVDSEPGHGTTFKLYFPRHCGPAGEHEKMPVECLQGGKETLLLVEDEPQILALCTRLLEQQGYTVLTAGLPGDAIALCEQYQNKIDLLVSDVIMPNMNGRELQERIARSRPDIKVLFMSGYTADKISRAGVLGEETHFIQKPFSNQDFILKIRDVLNQKK